MEKFNPSNPEYKKVADLPKEEQGNYADVEGGFVGKEAKEIYDKAEHSIEPVDVSPSILQKAVIKIERLIGDKSKTLEKIETKNDEKKAERAHEIISTILETASKNHLDVLVEVAKTPEEKKQLLKKFVEDFFQRAIEEVETSEYQKMLTGLKEVGHTGALYKHDCSRGGCQQIFGEIDGRKVNAHTDVPGSLGDIDLDAEHGSKLYWAYQHIAVDNDRIRRAKNRYEEMKEYALNSRADIENLTKRSVPDEVGEKKLTDLWSAVEEYRRLVIEEAQKEKEMRKKEDEQKRQKKYAELDRYLPQRNQE